MSFSEQQDNKKIYLYDSLPPVEDDDDNMPEKIKLFEDTIEFMQMFYTEKQTNFGAINHINIMPAVPEQENGYDCGVFVLAIAQQILHFNNAQAYFHVTQQMMPEFREHIYAQLYAEKLYVFNFFLINKNLIEPK